jgi:hypothetical protein
VALDQFAGLYRHRPLLLAAFELSPFPHLKQQRRAILIWITAVLEWAG